MTEDQKIPCWECEEGILIRMLEDYEVETKDGKTLKIPNTPLLKCPLCNDSVFDTDAIIHIEKNLPPYKCRSERKKKR
jgi:YgiT-type zinc finger domain-containing protein